MLINILIKLMTHILCDIISNFNLWLRFKSDKPNRRAVYRTEKYNHKFTYELLSVKIHFDREIEFFLLYEK